MFGGLFAFLRGALAGIANSTVNIEVLRNPAEGVRAGGASV